MTRKELKEHCEKQIRICEIWSKSAGVPKGKVYEEHKLILELLEQEPFINKPCVSSGVCEHDKNKVLDKIRAEIEQAVWEDVVVSLDGTDEIRIPRLEPNDVFKIIDKYRIENTEDRKEV